jgi:hypothetical protein
MKPKLTFDNGEMYARLIDEVNTINNVAFVSKGMMPGHLHMRLTDAAKKAQIIITKHVNVEKDPTAEIRDAVKDDSVSHEDRLRFIEEILDEKGEGNE